MKHGDNFACMVRERLEKNSYEIHMTMKKLVAKIYEIILGIPAYVVVLWKSAMAICQTL